MIRKLTKKTKKGPTLEKLVGICTPQIDSVYIPKQVLREVINMLQGEGGTYDSNELAQKLLCGAQGRCLLCGVSMTLGKTHKCWA